MNTISHDNKTSLPFALYDAFSATPFGGAQAGIVGNAAGLDAADRLQIAQEMGWPAICFLEAADATSVTVRFQSTVREYPMCGHGTVCLMTRLLDTGVLGFENQSKIAIELRLTRTITQVEIFRQPDNRALVLLDVAPPTFRTDNIDQSRLANLLGVNISDFHLELPMETAIGDFIHLVVPVTGLETIGAIKPDFRKLAVFCRELGIETVTLFCTEVENRENTIHVRDFCPAVGVDESAAAGTTNAALAAYLVRHNLVKIEPVINIRAEQGIEMGRASLLYSTVSISDGAITRLQVGGVATKIFDGQIYLPEPA